MIRVDVGQVYRLSESIGAAPYGVLREALTVTRKVVADTERDAKAACPVDTGNLRSSIGGESGLTPSGVLGEVGPTASYGAYVEYGTSRMAPQPYMAPAFDRHAESFAAAMSQLRAASL